MFLSCLHLSRDGTTVNFLALSTFQLLVTTFPPMFHKVFCCTSPLNVYKGLKFTDMEEPGNKQHRTSCVLTNINGLIYRWLSPYPWGSVFGYHGRSELCAYKTIITVTQGSQSGWAPQGPILGQACLLSRTVVHTLHLHTSKMCLIHVYSLEKKLWEPDYKTVLHLCGTEMAVQLEQLDMLFQTVFMYSFCSAYIRAATSICKYTVIYIEWFWWIILSHI